MASTAVPMLHFLVLAALAPFWLLAGRAAQRLRLPLITGMMLAGAATGPEALGLLNSDALAALTTVDHVCLSLIALAAGAELQLGELRKLRRQVTILTLAISAASWLAVFAAFQLLIPLLPFASALPGRVATAAASLAATIAMARSPASAIAVLRELGAKGPYSSLVMAVVVVKDVLVFVAFSVNVELARLASKSAEAALAWSHLAQPLLSVALAAALGTAAGYLLAALLQVPAGPVPHAHEGGSSNGGGSGAGSWSALAALSARLGPLRAAAPLAVSGMTFVAAEALGAEPLLACVTAGLVLTNVRRPPDAAGGGSAEALAHELHHLMPVINSVFFGLVGASLRLGALRSSAWAAAVLFLARLGGIVGGCAAGSAAAGGLDAPTRRRLWQGMVTQAGIALGLARIVQRRFPDWGPDLAALEAGVVLLNLAVGPLLFKAAVVAAGEAKAIGQGGGAAGGRRDGGGGRRDGIRLIPIIDSDTLEAQLAEAEW